MATSSITKQFKVYDTEMFRKLEKELDKHPLREIKKLETSKLNRGKEKLATFSFR